MAMESPHIRGEMYDAAEFEDVIRKYKIHGVPKIVINETIEFLGAQPERAFLSHVMKAAQSPDGQK